jgi:hypothetical protein
MRASLSGTRVLSIVARKGCGGRGNSYCKDLVLADCRLVHTAVLGDLAIKHLEGIHNAVQTRNIYMLMTQKVKDHFIVLRLLQSSLLLQRKCSSFGDQIFGYRNILSRFFAVPRLFDATKWRFCGR